MIAGFLLTIIEKLKERLRTKNKPKQLFTIELPLSRIKKLTP